MFSRQHTDGLHLVAQPVGTARASQKAEKTREKRPCTFTDQTSTLVAFAPPAERSFMLTYQLGESYREAIPVAFSGDKCAISTLFIRFYSLL